MTNDEETTVHHLKRAKEQMRLALLTEKDSGRQCWIEQQIQCTEATIWQYGEAD